MFATVLRADADLPFQVCNPAHSILKIIRNCRTTLRHGAANFRAFCAQINSGAKASADHLPLL
jgi:hypothetical protein